MSAPPSSAIEQLGKSSRRAAFVSFLGIGLVLVALIYSVVHLTSLKKQLDDELKNKKVELLEFDKQIQEKQLQVKVLNEVVASAASTNSEATKQAYQSALESNPGAADLLPRVSIQLRDQAQLPRARTVANALLNEGFSVPEFEVLGAKGTVHTYLRYFQNTPQVVKDREHILKILKGLNVHIEEQDFSQPEDSTTQQSRQYELWFGKDF
jgi:hypothetical protein